YRVICNLSDAAKLGEDTRFTLYNDDIVALCRDVCDKAAPLFELKGVALDFESDSPVHILALDAQMMRRLLLNLLSNALKATPGGGRVTVRLRSSQRFVQLSVTDTGCGIPPERLETIFESFLHADRSDLSPRGAGLGLALCRRIAVGHGGRIMAESAEGAGSTFTVSLPNVKSPNGRLGEPGIDYAGGFNPILVELSDALPVQAFAHQYLD
ncbi:MAG: HAMP domain-containing histidine kinase, partial [Oscillospiraceae bacterium]|nr:HAMP domain-containing histidine kinase [Oscillospiraceae bacterium]